MAVVFAARRPLTRDPQQELKIKEAKSAAEQKVSSAVETGSKYVPHTTPGGVDADYLPPCSMMYFVPLSLLGAYFAWRFYTTGSA